MTADDLRAELARRDALDRDAERRSHLEEPECVTCRDWGKYERHEDHARR